MNCPNCGSVIRDGLAFCTQCGTACPREIEIRSTMPSAQQHPLQMPVQQYSQQSSAQQSSWQMPQQTSMQSQPVQQVTQRSTPMSQAKPRERKSGSSVWVRVASVFLCIFLTVSLLATALVLDLRTITDSQQLAKTLEVALTPASVVIRPLAGGVELPDIEISPDMTADKLVDLVYEELQKTYGADLDISKAQLRRFYDKSTLPQRISELIAGYATDLFHGTQETEITEDDVMDIIHENEQLIESTFDVKVRDKLIREVLGFLDLEELNESIQQDVIEEISGTEVGGTTVGDLLQNLMGYASDGVLWLMVGINVLLIAALMLLNWRRLASGLRFVAIAMLVAGALLALPSILVPLLMGGNALVNVLVRTLLSSVALVHYGTLALGVILLAASIVLRVVTRKKG